MLPFVDFAAVHLLPQVGNVNFLKNDLVVNLEDPGFCRRLLVGACLTRYQSFNG